MAQKRRRVIYTVITAEYDFSFPPLCKQPGWDLICFTDDPGLCSNAWQICPLPSFSEYTEADAAQKARLVKLLPHRFLQEYEYSIYVDANRVLLGSLPAYLQAQGEPDLLCLASRHEDPYQAVRDAARSRPDKDAVHLMARPALTSDEKKTLKAQVKKWKAGGLPKGCGCPGTAVLGRRHAKVADAMEQWAELALGMGALHELALPYACHLTGTRWTEGLSQTAAAGELFSPAEHLAVGLPHAKRLWQKEEGQPVAVYAPNPGPPGGEYDGWPLLLTIGLPVSNQEKDIRRCLAGIKPLLDGLPAELVVVDTGCRDRTVQYCREAGARVLARAWDDDMSAARNEAVRGGLGLWYMSIDADEWFEDAGEILYFFREQQYKRYRAAHYNQRNYHDATMQVYRDNPSLRLAKRGPTLHFEGRIHDKLEGLEKGETAHLASTAHHLGFRKDLRLKTVDKGLRNIRLLRRDLAEFPQTLRYAFQMMQEYEVLEQYEDALRMGWWLLSMERQYPDALYRKIAISHMAGAFFGARAYPELLRFCDEYAKPMEHTIVAAAKLYYVQAVAHHQMGHEKPAKSMLRKYIDARGKYLALPPQQQQMQWAAAGDDYVNETSYRQVVALIGR